MVKVEVFSSPGCGKCTQAKNMLKVIVEEMGQGRITWREVNILEEMDYAMELGLMSSPAFKPCSLVFCCASPSPRSLSSTTRFQE